METIQILKNIGLSDQEAAVYLSAFKLGSSPASFIAKDAQIKRTTVYPILKKLTKKGFVSVFYKSDERMYLAQKPQKLARHFEKRLEDFTKVIPQLESMDRKQAQMIGLRFIETKDELKQFYNDILITYKNSSYDVIGSTPAWEGIDPEFFIQYRTARAQAKIKTRLLLSAESSHINPKGNSLLRKVKFLPSGYIFKSTIDIFNDQILVVSPELTSLAVVIAIPPMVDVFKSVFDIIWDTM